MMPGIQIQIVEAVQELLDDATFSQTISPDWNYPTRAFDLADLSTLRVDVVPGGKKAEHGDRGSLEYECRAVIVVRKKFAQSDRDADSQRAIARDAIAELDLFFEEIVEYLSKAANFRLTNDDGLDATWMSAELFPYDENDLKSTLYTGRIRLTYRASKQL